MNQRDAMADTTASRAATDRIVVVSIDSHVSPEVQEFRPFCETRYLDQLDEFIENIEEHLLRPTGISDGRKVSDRVLACMEEIERDYGPQDLNSDPKRRVQSLDEDGVAVEVVYHGGFNGQPIPFFSRNLLAHFGQDVPAPGEARNLRAAGIRMYNRWLADWVSVAPERLIGLGHIPMWDVDASVAEVRRFHADGLRGINMPAPRRGLPGLNEEVWNPFWEVACELGLTLHTHGGAGEIHPVEGQGAYSIYVNELFYASRRGLAQLILGGVFERFPDLKLVLTEQTGKWVTNTLDDLDAVYKSPQQERFEPHVSEQLPRLPSEYFRTNCYVGGSFMARHEADDAIMNGYWPNMMWGRDFPHPEGTWPFTNASLRMTFGGLPEEQVRAMLGGTAIEVLSLDPVKVGAIADEVGPSYADIGERLYERPEGSHQSCAFRTVGVLA